MPVSGGYDEEFIDSPSDHLKCVICCHVLKDPIQIMSCGHRYCAPCFEQIKTFSQYLNSPLICPVDREEIDLAQVFSDKGMFRMISDLRVKCSFQKDGCQWIGELRSLDSHKTSCQYVKPTTAATSLEEDNAVLMKEMGRRMDKCEEAVHEKEKEISYMKLLLQQTKDKVDKRDGEIILLKDAAKELLSIAKDFKTELMRLDEVMKKTQCTDEDKVNRLKEEVEETNKELAEIKISVDSVTKATLENDFHHKHEQSALPKLTTFQAGGSDRNVLVEDLQHQTTESMSSIKDEVEDLQHKTTESMSIIKDEVEDLQHQTTESISSINDEVEDLQHQTTESISSIKDEMEDLQQQTTEFISCIKDEVRSMSEKLQHLEEKMKKERKASVEEIVQELDIVRGQQLHVDSLFRMNRPPLRSTRFTWRIDRFREQWEARNVFYSPKFFSLPDGHLCQLYCLFLPSNSKDMGIFFRLCRCRNTPATGFKGTIMFDLMYNDGRKKSHTIPLEDVKKFQSRNFTLKDGEDHTRGRGPTKFFECSKFDDFVEDDTCVVICTVTPAS